METIFSNPGLQHLAEKVFWDLDVEDLKICAKINSSCKMILQNPIFSLNKFQHLSNDNRKDWIKALQSVKHSDKGIAIISYLQWNFKKNASLNLPCYTNATVQDEFRRKIWESCEKEKSSDEDTEIVKILAPLTDNPNDPAEDGDTPIYWAACNGHTEIIKILITFTDNPNTPDNDGWTPIYWSALNGHTEVTKILAPLTVNPDAPDKFGTTPISWAARIGYTEIIKILAPLSENLNSPNKFGKSPLYWAVQNRHTEIVKILTSMIENKETPNL